MRILIVSQYFWPESFRINDLAKTLTEKGIEVDVLTGKPNYPEGCVHSGYRVGGCQVESWNGVTLYRVPLIPRGRKSALRLGTNYLSFIFSATLLGPWLLRGRGYDAIFVYGVSPIFQAIPAFLIGRLKRSPVLVWVQDLWPDSLKATGYVSNPWVLAFFGQMVGRVYRHADLLLAQSRSFIPFINALAPGRNVRFYPNSVDNTFVGSSPAVLPQIPALDKGFPVVFAGNIGVGQAVEVIVEAAFLLKNHADIRFVVLGDGSRRDWMCEQVKVRGLTNLHLPGRFPVEAMPGLMHKAGALLVSLADEPIFAATVPNKLQAYLASGRPIVASLSGEAASLVDEAQAGLTCPAGDSKALADAVLRLFQMTAQERAVLGENGRRYFEDHFDHNMLTDQLIGHLTAAVENQRKK